MSNASNILNTTPARFTKEEKAVLYELFQENEDIIDIKQRKNSAKKNCSVRDCWDKIAALYNENPNIVTMRNVKQIQKFWLNARLRKHYPANNSGSRSSLNSSSQPKEIKKFEKIELVTDSEVDNIKFENECENEEIEMLTEEDEALPTEIEISTSSNDVMMENHSQQYNIDHISAEKLTLNDLLEFKNTRTGRGGDEIVLQIKGPDLMGTVQTQTQQHINQKDHTTQPTFATSYRIRNSNGTAAITLSDQHYQTPIIQQQIVSPALQHVHNKLVSSTPYTQNAQQQQTKQGENYDEQIRMKEYQIKCNEYDFKCKENQLKLEKAKIDLAIAKELLKHTKEMNIFHIDEIKAKIKSLQSEDKKSKITSTKK